MSPLLSRTTRLAISSRRKSKLFIQVNCLSTGLVLCWVPTPDPARLLLPSSPQSRVPRESSPRWDRCHHSAVAVVVAKQGSKGHRVWGTRHGSPLAGCGARKPGGLPFPTFSPFPRVGGGRRGLLNNPECPHLAGPFKSRAKQGSKGLPPLCGVWGKRPRGAST